MFLQKMIEKVTFKNQKSPKACIAYKIVYKILNLSNDWCCILNLSWAYKLFIIIMIKVYFVF